MKKMKNIRESLANIPSLVDCIGHQTIDEGILSDGLKYLKTKFREVVSFIGGWIAKIGYSSYWVPVTENGDVLSAVSYYTPAQAYVDGNINKETTFILPSRDAARATGCRANIRDAYKIYGSGTTLDYWKSALHESLNIIQAPDVEPVNEVLMKNSDPNSTDNVITESTKLAQVINLTIRSNRGNIYDKETGKWKHQKFQGPPLLIFGAPGIGKTAILESVLDGLPDADDWTLIAKSIADETAENFTLPKYTDDYLRKTDVPATWIPVYKVTGIPEKDAEASAACGKGVLFIDELSRAGDKQVLNICLTLLQSRRFGKDYRLGEDWVVIGASNRIGDDDNQHEMSTTLTTRLNVVYYEPTAKTWAEWARKQKYISPVLIEWLCLPEKMTHSGQKYFYWDPNEGADEKTNALMATPRTWDNAMKNLANWGETGIEEGFDIFDVPTDILKLCLNMCIPAEAVESFMAFLKVISAVGDLGRARDQIWNKGSFKINVSSQELRDAALPFTQIIISGHETLPTEKEFENLCTWLVNDGNDQITSYALDIFQEVFFNGLLHESLSTQCLFRVKQEVLDRQKQDPEKAKIAISRFDSSCQRLLQEYGFKSITEFPNYWPAMMLLSKKYGSTFEKYKVDGADALG